MAPLPASARALLNSGALAHCVTINADGSPQVSAVWVDVEDTADGERILMAHTRHYLKIRNLERDPRIVLSLQGEGRNELGMQDYLVVHGTATVTEGPVGALLKRVAKIYNGPDAEFPLADDTPGWVVYIAVNRIGGHGPWAEPQS